MAPEGKTTQTGSFAKELNGRQIHYEVHGMGPTLMVLPNAWGITVAGLRGLYRGLEKHFTLVYFDPRGMGGSGPVAEESDMGLAAVREDFVVLKAYLGLTKVDVIGWSNGAMNLILLASEQSDSISAAVFLHGAASFDEADHATFAEEFPDLVQSYAGFEEKLQDENLSDAEKNSLLRTTWLEQLLPLSCADYRKGQSLVAQALKNNTFSWRHAAYSGNETSVFDFRHHLKRIEAKSLVVSGKHDTIPIEKAREIREGIANSELVVLEASGHFAPVEEPEEFERIIVDFMK
jgi:proline iminopeptidase